MSVFSEIERLEGAKNALAASIEGKGVAVPEGTKIDGMAALVEQIQGGGGADFYIDDASYLFYKGARESLLNQFLPLLRDINSMQGMFQDANENFAEGIDLSGVDLTNVKNMDNAFRSCAKIPKVVFGTHGTISPSTMAYAFAYCTNLKTANISMFDASGCSSLHALFGNCINLESVDLSSFLVEGKISCDAGAMLQNCTKLKSIDMSNFDTSRFSNMDKFLDSDRKIEEIVGFSSVGVTGATGMFPRGSGPSGISNLKRLTFRADLPDGKCAIRSPIDIRYCSFDRAGMAEMFGTLPDISGLTLSASYKNITITGNPCVTDGTLTDEDKAIAIGKGWTIVI